MGRQVREGDVRACWPGLLLGALLVVACGQSPEASAPGEDAAPVEEGRVPFDPEEVVREVRAAHAEDRRLIDVSRPEPEPRVTAQSGPSVAFDGERFLVVWLDEREGGVFGARVEPDGTLLDPVGIALNPGGSELEAGTPAVAYDGRDFLVVWTGDGTGLFGIHVRSNGRLREASPVRLFTETGAGRYPALACGPKLCLVAWELFAGEVSNIHLAAARVRRDLTTPDEQPLMLSLRGFGVSFPSIAWDGGQFLVVWTDFRRSGTLPTLFGGRVKADGTLRDPGGFPISTAESRPQRSDVAWTGEHFLVVWDDFRNFHLGDSDVYGARVERDGSVLDPEGIPISTAPSFQSNPRVAHQGGSRSLVVWDDRRTGDFRIHGARVTEGGAVLDPGSLRLSSGDFPFELNPAIAYGCGQYFVAFSGTTGFPSHILGLRVSTSGKPKDSHARILSRSPNRQETPAVAYGEGRYLAVWREFPADAAPRLYAVRVRRDGRLLDRQPILLPGGPLAERPAVAFDGEDFLVVWQESELEGGRSGIRGARVSPGGRLLDTSSIPIATATPREVLSEPAVASSGEGALVVWTNEPEEERPEIHGARVRRGVVLEPSGIRLSPLGDFQSTPAVAYDGRQYLAVWRSLHFDYSTQTETFSIQGTRVSTGGEVLDPEGLVLSTGPQQMREPAVASDGLRSLVTWLDSRATPGTFDVLGARVDREGVVLDPENLPITTTAPLLQRSNPRVIFDGDHYRVVWEETPRFGFLRLDLAGARVGPDGTVLDPGGEKLVHGPTSESSPALASDGDGHSALFFQQFVLDRVNALRVRGLLLQP
ncbi:hypothetical protein NR798_21810 [Archangium gephyra]|uniref:hypothetical protein n=1 Tax=Archangium gephyra TaxID=48 RepID=UPI0035D459D0